MKASTQVILEELIARLPELAACKAPILASYEALEATFRSGGKLMICGNGGSASDAEHIVGELMKGFKLRRGLQPCQVEPLAALFPQEGEQLAKNLQRALPAVSLCSHTSLMTAYVNDVSPDMVFAQQVFGLGRAGDALIGISTSGNSANVVNAVKVAKALGVKTIGLTGGSGGRLAELCDAAIVAPAAETYRVQEYYLPIYHALCAMLEEEFFG